MAAPHYVIRGGVEGRERLRVLARVMRPTTLAVLQPLIAADARCLDVGCGGGDVSLELAWLAPEGLVVGVDVDETKLGLARDDASVAGLRNVEFRTEDVLDPAPSSERFDVVYARFVLSHLPDARRAVVALRDRLAPGGVLVVEDVDTDAMFCYPPSDAFQRFVDLYVAAVQARGADPNIGPRLPGLLRDAGLTDVEVRVVQPTAIQGDVKHIVPITLEAIVDAAVADGLATRAELDTLVDELWEFATADGTLSSTPRVVQSWARRSL